MPELIAKAEAWIATSCGISATQDGFQDQGFIMESFDSILDQVPAHESVVAVMRRVPYAPTRSTLFSLCVQALETKHQTASLQKQSSLGHWVALVNHFAMFLCSLDHGDLM